MKTYIQFWVMSFVVFTFAFCGGCTSFSNDERAVIRSSNQKSHSKADLQRNKSVKQSNSADVNIPNLERIAGCWSGMRGGKLIITAAKIRDLVSKEESEYSSVKQAEKPQQGLQTGEKYLIETKNGLKESFLTRFIEISFNRDGTVGFESYESYQDYEIHKISGAGLFEKIDCSKFE